MKSSSKHEEIMSLYLRRPYHNLLNRSMAVQVSRSMVTAVEVVTPLRVRLLPNNPQVAITRPIHKVNINQIFCYKRAMLIM